MRVRGRLGHLKRADCHRTYESCHRIFLWTQKWESGGRANLNRTLNRPKGMQDICRTRRMPARTRRTRQRTVKDNRTKHWVTSFLFLHPPPSNPSSMSSQPYVKEIHPLHDQLTKSQIAQHRDRSVPVTRSLYHTPAPPSVLRLHHFLHALRHRFS